MTSSSSSLSAHHLPAVQDAPTGPRCEGLGGATRPSWILAQLSSPCAAGRYSGTPLNGGSSNGTSLAGSSGLLSKVARPGSAPECNVSAHFRTALTRADASSAASSATTGGIGTAKFLWYRLLMLARTA